MLINFDVVVESDDYSVDMHSGLETFRGASEVTKHIAESLLTEHVHQKLNPTSKVRTKLKKSFKGSFGQTFALEFDDPDLNKRFRAIGKGTFTELMSYFINMGLYKNSPKLSAKAEKVLDNLGEVENTLILQLRKSSLMHLHAVSIHHGKSVKFNYRQNSTDKIKLADINRESSYTLQPKTDSTVRVIIASITRFNINTGNGRLLIMGENETVAFGFPTKYKEVRQASKKKFSTNLDQNNGRPNDEWKTLTLEAYTLTLKDKTIIKYFIKGVFDD